MDSKRSRDYKYSTVNHDEPGDVRIEALGDSTTNRRPTKTLLTVAMGSTLIAAALFLAIGGRASKCCTEKATCSGSLGTWGQYSPWAPAPSKVDPAIPPECKVTFAQVLSRHGSRGPTADKGAKYAAFVEELQDSITEYAEGFKFLKDYKYDLTTDDLSPYGENEMVESGKLFYSRYKNLAAKTEPFVRASGSGRVIMSAQNFTQGYYGAQGRNGDDFAARILVIPEEEGYNNTLEHGSCKLFEEGPGKKEGSAKQKKWKEIWVPPVQKRLSEKLPGAEFDIESTVYFMELCPFETVASPSLALSPFCRAFSVDEWRSYDYHQSLEKWYVYGPGRDLASSQGVGFVNELLARLTGQPVRDHTSTNSTLDGSPATFPLDRALYADFSHDNGMMTVFTALRLFEGTEDLPTTRRASPEQLGGYSASWAVPFGARMYVEKLQCGGGDEELVRILLNDRVVPLHGCDADELGRCRLDKFVESMKFATSGGEWSRCG
ncbi:3-phytase B precursor [Cordyceps fumosorosea ARSEF 2679]|uniref:Phytase A n=1 Tax=Cordyceps fumosorosea (strain ARSEF 2679) TaxID=1081104 RepID=A0A168APN2_CORFA|nr:3-phytase B precursor [Cordyceps fumosorosea ARSEF 2679]OAA69020.1 3-phytase B precursor [Cordyceps fumosorosea ARSEF 2679]